MTVEELPELDFFGAAYAADPYPVLRAAREQHWAARSLRGVEVLTYAKCEDILTDERFHDGASKMMDYLGEDAVRNMGGEGRTLTMTEGAEHAALRRVVAPYFTPK